MSPMLLSLVCAWIVGVGAATVPGDPNTIWNATTNPNGVKCDGLQQLVNQLERPMVVGIVAPTDGVNGKRSG